MNKFARTAPAALILLLAMAGCATIGENDASPGAETAAERAQQRWDLLLEGDYAGAYQYLSPGYRSSLSLDNYQRQQLLRRVGWRGAQVESSDCDEQRCTVNVEIEYSITKPLPGVPRYQGKSVDAETWILSENQWWMVPEN